MRSVPIMNITEKLDLLFFKGGLPRREKLLEYWLTEAREIGDERGELSLCRGHGTSRRIRRARMGNGCGAPRGTELCRSLGLAESVSGVRRCF